ncbi:hypothetical protein BO94DRAFT_578646 [Aspergillus sclerotioniger CBS 115572]|uniref:Uncharacterized protein n=1 Tax=Aspergillus sclerotioniger CBS 115572 TaxID=1450535 RepID=A0A317VF04_9EURO|nr:hypothetical protein BO94DRAFT_578646 [Aspergillus sclerotioniger CBS 115572]PWY71781.1 hypothetical protein BO94DRAFT_578646 [Aspergillus sclerotioniger CBS 115572]
MPAITTTVEIAAPPSTVRAKFLDFASIPSYTPTGFIRSIVPADNKPPTTLQPGDKLTCIVGYGKMTFTPVVRQNTPSLFSWIGSLPGVFTGEHRFVFEEIPNQPGRTRLVHEERFSGMLGFLMGGNLMANAAGWNENTRSGFESFNRDFKLWVEGK